MAPVKTGELVSGIYAIKNAFVNAYLVKSSNGYIAIDAGINVKKMAQELDLLKIDPNQVQAVFLTHSDSDHAGGLKVFPNAKVYLSKAEEQMINGETGRFGFIKNTKLKNYTTLTDQQILTIDGLSIQLILIPGHTPGSSAFLVNDNLLFVGDSASLIDGQIEVFNKFFNMDTDRQKQSLLKLAKLENFDYLFTSHYGFTKDVKKAFEKWFNK